MTVDALRRALQTQPFQPFVLRFASGDEALIPHPEFLWVHPTNARTVVVGDPDGGFQIVDILLVERLDFVPNRRKKRRAG